MTDRWEVVFLPIAIPTPQQACPDGWEPFAATDRGVRLRRRVEPVQVRPVPRGVLTDGERAKLLNSMREPK